MNFCKLQLDNGLLDMTPKAYTAKEKIDKLTSSKLKSLCFKGHYQESEKGTSLVVQWLRRHASPAGGAGSIPGQGTKIPHARVQLYSFAKYGQKKKKVKRQPTEWEKTFANHIYDEELVSRICK